MIGANTEAITCTTLHGWMHGLFVEFEPGGMRALLGVNMQKMFQTVIPLSPTDDAALVAQRNVIIVVGQKRKDIIWNGYPTQDITPILTNLS